MKKIIIIQIEINFNILVHKRRKEIMNKKYWMKVYWLEIK